MLRKSELKKIIISASIILIISIISIITINKIQYKKYTNIINNKIVEIISNVQELADKEDIEIDDQEIIEILRKKSNGTQGTKLLESYGYNGDYVYINQLNDEMKMTQIYETILIIAIFILTITIWTLYTIKQNKKIHEIDMYLKKVNSGDYTLKIEENSEDELSKLRNELYKTTVLLREAAENSKKENINLSNSLADISHQLKTPLTSIRIMIDNIYDNPDMDEETKMDFIKSINNQIEWISSLVVSLLKLAKFDAGTIVMNDENVNIIELINNVKDNLSIILELKEIDIILEYDHSKPIIVSIDYTWQLEALTNIIKNAIEHSKNNSKIHIKIEDSSVFTKIIIEDEGEGISKKDLPHIFQRFYKSEKSSENSIGIGLSLAKTIIEKDNGYINVKSEEGKGTTFYIKYMKK